MSLLDKVKQRREEYSQKKASQTRTYKFKVGKTFISILPLHSDAQDFTKPFGMHYIKNRKGEFVAAIGDAQTTYGTECPVREALSELRRHAANIGDDDLMEQTTSSLARPTNLVNICIHKDPDGKGEDIPQLASFSDGLMEQFYSLCEEYLEEDPTKLLRLEDRMQFIVEREGTGVKDTRYKVFPAAKSQTITAETLGKATVIEDYIAGQFADGQQKALSYVASVTGRASIASSGTFTKALTAPKAKDDTASDVEFSVVDDDEDAVMVKPASKKSASTDDDDLDALMASLED